MSIEFLRVTIALGLGVAIGLERSFAHKTAGMRTYGLVSMGSCLFVLLGQLIVPAHSEALSPIVIASAVVTGIGFLCGGVIIFQNHHLSGLTTAAGLWLTAGVGMAVGFGQVTLAAFCTVLTLAVFTLFWFLEQLVTKLLRSKR